MPRAERGTGPATSYVVATIRSWNLSEFRRRRAGLPGAWHLVRERDQLTGPHIRRLAPRFVFFPHWSWPVGEDVLDATECVCFHMTEVPYGRGGSPLQNLIALGHAHTVISALRMVKELDAGPVYTTRPLDLSGRAQEIYRRAAVSVFDMIEEIVREEPTPTPQSGAVVYFRRRTPAQSVLPDTESLVQLYDHIRMLDADGYPRAYLACGRIRIEFSRAKLAKGVLRARATLRLKGGE